MNSKSRKIYVRNGLDKTYFFYVLSKTFRIFNCGFVVIATILYDVPVCIIVLLSMFYGTISVMAVVGNALVMWIVTSSRRMHNVTNLYIANLALADIVIGLFSIPFQVSINYFILIIYLKLVVLYLMEIKVKHNIFLLCSILFYNRL